jgi:hypothetical protein
MLDWFLIVATASGSITSYLTRVLEVSLMLRSLCYYGKEF